MEINVKVSGDASAWDCRCPNPSDNWRYGAYIDPEDRTIRPWQMYGSGTPVAVWHNRAIIVDIPRGSVGQFVLETVSSVEFRRRVSDLCDLYEGSEWNGSNYVGKWRDETCDVETALVEFFEDVPIYWTAADFMQASWDEGEAADIRAKAKERKSLEKVVEEMVEQGRTNNAYVDYDDLLETVQELLNAYPDA